MVEDDPSLLKLIRSNLEREGYDVVSARTAERGLVLIKTRAPEAVVLDIMLPGMDGLEMCRRIRRDSGLPILFTSAKSAEFDKVVGLKLGGDDYLTKPFSLNEFLARVEALLRRSKKITGPREGVFCAGALAVDPHRREARLRGRGVNLTPKEFDLLVALFQAEGRVLSRATLLERVWGLAASAELDTRTVDQHVARLRRKLRGEGARIRTAPRKGYKLLAGPLPGRRA